MPTYGATMGPRSTSRFTSVDLRGIWPVLFGLAEQLGEPRKSLERNQMMEALSTVAKLGGFQTLSRLPEEWAKPVFEKLFTYKPGTTRSLFKGEKPELMIPQPKAEAKVAPEEETYLESTKGMEGYVPAPPSLRYQTQYFPKGMTPPLLEPETEQEIRTKMKALGASEEEINDALQEKLLGSPKGVEARRDQMIDQAENWMQNYRQSNPMAGPDEPLVALRKARPGLARNYDMFSEEKKQRMLTLKSAEEEMKGRTEARKVETARKDIVTKQTAIWQKWKMDFEERKLKLKAKNDALIAKGKSATQVYKDAITAYEVYKKAWVAEQSAYDKMQIQFKKDDPNYVITRFDEPLYGWSEWLERDGFMFAQRIAELKGIEGEGKGEGVTPPPSPRSGAPQDRKNKMRDFLNKGGAPRTPQPTQGE